MANGFSQVTKNNVDYLVNDPNITDEFSTSKAYSIGQYTNYQGLLYRFKTAHSAGVWNSAHVEAVKLGDDVSKIRKNTVISTAQYIFPKNFGADVLDGDLNLIIVDGINILIDTHRSVAWEQVVVFFNEHNVTHLDYFILTHYHGDHYQNVSNLISEGYIDVDTVVYLAPIDEYLSDYSNIAAAADVVYGLFEDAGITTIFPTENSFFMASTMKITFYNTDPTVMRKALWSTDYNECSMLCMVEHGINTILYTGDAGDVALKRAVDNGFISKKVDLYKINHHGINYSSNIIPILKVLHPTFAVQPSSMGDDQKNNHSKNTVNEYLRILGTDIYACHNSPVDIVFESNMSTMKNIDGVPIVYGGTKLMTETFYVDISTDNDVQNGSEEYPFKELNQALSHCLPYASVQYTLILADGTYNVTHEATAKNTISANGVDVNIIGASSDETSVIIKNGGTIYNSHVSLRYVTLDVTDELLTVDHTRLYFYKVIVTKEGSQGGTFVYAKNDSVLYVGNCTFNNFNRGIHIESSKLFYWDDVFTNGNEAVYVSSSGQAILTYPNSCTYTNVTKKVSETNYAYRNGEYTFSAGATSQAYLGAGRHAGLIILLNSEGVNLYFWDRAGTNIRINSLVEKLETNPVTYSTSGGTVTFNCAIQVTMFALQF